MKKILGALAILVAVIVIAAVAASFFLGNIVKQAVDHAGPKVLGVPVSVANVDMNAFSGKATVTGLKVGSPETFKSENVFKLGSFDTRVKMLSILSDTVRIQSVRITRPVINYEVTIRGSNIGEILQNLEKKKKKKDEPAPEDRKDKKKKKVIIEHLLMEDAIINVIVPGVSEPATVKLDRLELKDLGEGSQGLTAVKATSEIIEAVAEAVYERVKESGDFSKLEDELSSQVQELESSLSKQAKELGDAITNQAGKMEVDPGKALDQIDKLFQ